MQLVSYFLLIAAQLAVLTYYIGVLIYMLPIPLRSVKRWAPLLIQDGLWASILITLFTAMLKFSDVIASMSGYTIESIVSYMQVRMKAIIMMEYITRLTVGVLSSVHSIIGKFFSIYILPMMLVHYGMLTAAATVIVIASILSAAKAKLAALGIALMAIPFRIGRNAGASLLAFIIVGNVMLPFLPYWISLIYGSLATSYLSEVFVHNYTESIELVHMWGIVRDKYGYRPVTGLVKFIDISNNGIYRFIVHEDGGYYITRPLKALPSGKYHVEVEYLGHNLGVEKSTVNIPEDAKLTYELDEAEYRLDFTVSDVVFIEPVGLMIVRSCNITDINQTVYTINVQCKPRSKWIMLTITIPDKANMTMISPTRELFEEYNVVELASPWRGMQVRTIIFSLKVPDGIKLLSIKFNKRIDNYTYNLEISEGYNYSNMTMEDVIVYYIIYGTAFPITVFSYLTIMSMMTISFARLIGASSPRIVFD